MKRVVAALAAVLVAGGAAWALLHRAAAPKSRVTPRAVALQVPAPVTQTHDRGDNALWLSRHWLYETPGETELDELARACERLGITRLYFFLGPADEHGVPGWRGGGEHHPYDLAQAKRLFTELKRRSPKLKLFPWTGGILSRDVVWADRARLTAWLEELAKLIDAGADGVHFNIEPVPDGDPGLTAFLEQARQRLGAQAHLSVAVPLFRIDGYQLPQKQRLWSFESVAEVCRHADDLSVMAYDTYQTDPADYRRTMAEWTDGLARLRGCEVLIGVPSYEDDAAHHRPEVERIDVALQGINGGREPWPEHLRGVAVYGSWTTDSNEWDVYEALWRGRAPSSKDVPER